MSIFRILGVVVAAGLLAGCTSNIERVASVQPTGSAFTQALTTGYQGLTAAEKAERDWSAADWFAQKGLSAAAGENVLPDEPSAEYPSDELTQQRARLMTALDGGGRDTAPELAALAQVKYDCWAHEWSEDGNGGYASKDAADYNCQEDFLKAMDDLEAALAPKQEAAPAPMAPKTYIVYFDFDKSNIRPDAQAVINDVLADSKAMGAPAISVTGHADRSGPVRYNEKLSERRAGSVRDALINGGVAADKITVAWRGESEPAVPTADGVREQKNRRVEVIVQ